jgi:phosphopantothenate synthetase
MDGGFNIVFIDNSANLVTLGMFAIALPDFNGAAQSSRRGDIVTMLNNVVRVLQQIVRRPLRRTLS